jgi:hypothetical protein
MGQSIAGPACGRRLDHPGGRTRRNLPAVLCLAALGLAAAFGIVVQRGRAAGLAARAVPVRIGGEPTVLYMPYALSAVPLRSRHPDPALAERLWAATERLIEVYPAETMLPSYGPGMTGASPEAAWRNVDAACHDYPDLPTVFGEGVHHWSCYGAVASYLAHYHANAALRGVPGEHALWARHYFDLLLEVTEDFTFGPGDARSGRGYRDTFAAMWQNPLRAVDVVVNAELLRRLGELDPPRQARTAEVLSAIARAWHAEFWQTGVHPSTGVTLTIRTADEVPATSLGGRQVVSTVPWAIAWDADRQNSSAEETAWMGAGVMLTARALARALPDAAELYAAGRHYVDYSLAYDRPDPIHGGTIRTLSDGSGAGTYGQRRYWLKNHAVDAPAMPYVGSTWHSIGTALFASDLGDQRPWPDLAPDGRAWWVMLAGAEESLYAADGTFLVDLSPEGGIGYDLTAFPAWWTPCGQSAPGRGYTQYDGRAGGRALFVSEIGLPAGVDVLAAARPITRLAAWRGDTVTYERWSDRMDRVLDAYTTEPPSPYWTTCKFAPYVSDNPAYAWARLLSVYMVAYLGASGFTVDPWPLPASTAGEAVR